jgi:hypothetical protein
MQIAVAADCEERTVWRYFQGSTKQPAAVQNAIRLALLRLGVTDRVSSDAKAGAK